MAQLKYYCLGCERPNNCKCGNQEKRFNMSYKCRPPLTTKNKAKWRQFLIDCPIFGNCVPEHLKEDFIAFLKKIKHDGKLNGRVWF